MEILITNGMSLEECKDADLESCPRVWKDEIRGWRFATSWQDEGVGSSADFPTHGRRDTFEEVLRACRDAENKRRELRCL